MKATKYITEIEIKELIETKHSVFAYPRKKEIVVDGFKRFKAKQNHIELVQKLNLSFC